MKGNIIQIALVGIMASLAVAQETNDELQFKATFSEGFGKLLKRDFILKRLDPYIGCKREGNLEIFIEVKTDKGSVLLPVCRDAEMLTRLEKDFGNANTLKITGIGYETIKVGGVPSLSESTTGIDYMPPQDTSWYARNEFVLHSYTL